MDLWYAVLVTSDDGVVDEKLIDNYDMSETMKKFLIDNKKPSVINDLPDDPSLIEWALMTGRCKRVRGYDHAAVQYKNLTDCINILRDTEDIECCA